MKAWCLLAGLALLVGGCNGNNPDRVDRDNTAVNERDAVGDQLTPFDQSNEQRDINLVAEIYSRVLELEDLSVNGRNVKIITENGRVTLRGPVDSASEKDRIGEAAASIAGASNVSNELEVASG